MNRGRPRSFCPEQALENAMQVFWQRGYEATSLQDLLTATGLSKSSLYQTYPSKLAWFEAAFARYCHNRQQLLLELLEQSSSPLDYIRSRLLGVLDDDGLDGIPRGCMLVNVANEFSLNQPSIALLMKKATEGGAQVLTTALKRAQALGELDAQADTEALGFYLQCVISGLRTQVKSGLSADQIKATVTHVMNSLN
ncbi:TetR/AcrR family transcriptional regulator [Pseudomonas sp. M30-35]|uniref:TetR/AcrR family transcriptional regulator n=1 Tax=Pseudomonas sp. M30-35 TaxID=1981174 RepID=UPI000B3D0F4C|nr:TetR/AcrR family transcriptional regulator [Pseudomonas sp. M30-35]ARU86869.1 TetR family transcriptional regulator [Pseudomonas sp. M30-35]